MELDEGWKAPDGTALRLRRLRKHDAPALGALIESLPPRDRRWRFHGAVNGLSREQLERLTGVDETHHVAFAVTVGPPEHEALLAEARWVVDETGSAAEIALTVAPGWRRRGIGERCIRALLRAASARNLDWLYGTVLADNAPMLALMRRCGFQSTRKRGYQSMMLIEARVSGALR
jgi:ribosomal protein S18 acetylase RimI-like enzyme